MLNLKRKKRFYILWIYILQCSILCLLFSFFFYRTKMKTYHDVIPISCLTEFPNIVQMAKVRVNHARRGWRGQHYCFLALQFITLLSEWHDWSSHSPKSLFCPAWTDDHSIASLLQDQIRMRRINMCFLFSLLSARLWRGERGPIFPGALPKGKQRYVFIRPTCTIVISFIHRCMIPDHLSWLIKVWHWEIH